MRRIFELFQPVCDQKRGKEYDQKNGKGAANDNHISDTHLEQYEDL